MITTRTTLTTGFPALDEAIGFLQGGEVHASGSQARVLVTVEAASTAGTIAGLEPVGRRSFL